MSYPYISGANNIIKMIEQLHSNFPAKINSDTVKKFDLAPNNESYVINALVFIGAIDEEGNRCETARKIFLLDFESDEFKKQFGDLIKTSYKGLFDDFGEKAWSLSKNKLTTFFRTEDNTGETIGNRQAALFIAFRNLAGYKSVEEKSNKKIGQTKIKTNPKIKKEVSGSKDNIIDGNVIESNVSKDIALTVRVEINLPSNGSLETYDNIFNSIRKNLIGE